VLRRYPQLSSEDASQTACSRCSASSIRSSSSHAATISASPSRGASSAPRSNGLNTNCARLPSHRAPRHSISRLRDSFERLILLRTFSTAPCGARCERTNSTSHPVQARNGLKAMPPKHSNAHRQRLSAWSEAARLAPAIFRGNRGDRNAPVLPVLCRNNIFSRARHISRCRAD